MKHLDARAIRERLNSITLALSTLEECSVHAHHAQIAARAREALHEIAVLVTDDEMEEHGAVPITKLRQARLRIRAATEQEELENADPSMAKRVNAH